LIDSNVVQVIHYAITGATSVIMGIFAYKQYLSNKASAENVTQSNEDKAIQQIMIRLAVLEERSQNESEVLDKLADRLQDLRDKL